MDEKRKTIRFDAIHLLDYLVLDQEGHDTTYSMGRTLDVSANGLKLETTHPLDPHSRLRITVGMANELVDLTGTVTYCRAVRNRYISGISFNGITSDSKRIYALYTEAFSRRKFRQ